MGPRARDRDAPPRQGSAYAHGRARVLANGIHLQRSGRRTRARGAAARTVDRRAALFLGAARRTALRHRSRRKRPPSLRLPHRGRAGARYGAGRAVRSEGQVSHRRAAHRVRPRAQSALRARDHHQRRWARSSRPGVEPDGGRRADRPQPGDVRGDRVGAPGDGRGAGHRHHRRYERAGEHSRAGRDRRDGALGSRERGAHALRASDEADDVLGLPEGLRVGLGFRCFRGALGAGDDGCWLRRRRSGRARPWVRPTSDAPGGSQGGESITA